MRTIFLAILILFLVPQTLQAGDSDHDAVTKAVFDYFDGYQQADMKRIARAFQLDDAEMMTVEAATDGTPILKIWPLTDVAKRWTNRPPLKKPIIGKIVSMSVVDGKIASVVFDFNGQYTDILTLAKIGDDWKIVNKLFITK